MFKGTQSSDIIKLILKHYPDHQRKIVREVTLDMAASMNLIIKKCFPRAKRVTDRFHVQKLAYEAVQDIRIKYRWETLDAENKAYKEAKEKGIEYEPEVLSNGDTKKQLLARSRYLLFKPEERWTLSQWERAQVLFELYPDIEKAYKLSYKLYQIYNRQISPDIARTKLALWFNISNNQALMLSQLSEELLKRIMTQLSTTLMVEVLMLPRNHSMPKLKSSEDSSEVWWM